MWIPKVVVPFNKWAMKIDCSLQTTSSFWVYPGWCLQLKKCVGQTSLVNYEVFRDSTQLIMFPHHWPWISYIAWSSLWSCWPLKGNCINLKHVNAGSNILWTRYVWWKKKKKNTGDPFGPGGPLAPASPYWIITLLLEQSQTASETALLVQCGTTQHPNQMIQWSHYTTLACSFELDFTVNQVWDSYCNVSHLWVAYMRCWGKLL